MSGTPVIVPTLDLQPEPPSMVRLPSREQLPSPSGPSKSADFIEVTKRINEILSREIETQHQLEELERTIIKFQHNVHEIHMDILIKSLDFFYSQQQARELKITYPTILQGIADRVIKIILQNQEKYNIPNPCYPLPPICPPKINMDLFKQQQQQSPQQIVETVTQQTESKEKKERSEKAVSSPLPVRGKELTPKLNRITAGPYSPKLAGSPLRPGYAAKAMLGVSASPRCSPKIAKMAKKVKSKKKQKKLTIGDFLHKRKKNSSEKIYY